MIKPRVSSGTLICYFRSQGPTLAESPPMRSSIQKVIISSGGLVLIAIVTATSSAVTAEIDKPAASTPGSSAPVTINVPATSEAPIVAKKSAPANRSPKCPDIPHQGKLIQISFGSEDANGEDDCLQAHVSLGRISTQQWWTAVHNTSSEPISAKLISIHWDIPSELRLVPGTTDYSNDSGANYLISDQTVSNGLKLAGVLPPHSWFWISFITVTNASKLPECTDRTVWAAAYLDAKSEQPTVTNWASVYMTDQVTWC